jgi:hypothetical protein
METNGQRHAQAALSPGKDAGTRWTGGWQTEWTGVQCQTKNLALYTGANTLKQIWQDQSVRTLITDLNTDKPTTQVTGRHYKYCFVWGVTARAPFLPISALGVQSRGKYDFGTESARNKPLLSDAQDKNGKRSLIQKAWEDIGNGLRCEDNFW